MPAHKKSAPQKSAQKKPAKRARPDPDIDRSYQDDLVSARRKICTHLSFWKFCGHRPCRRAQRCAHPSNECFGRFWPEVPDSLKQGIRAGIEAASAGLPASEIAAAIERTVARCEEAQVTSAPEAATPPAAAQVPPQPIAAPTRAAPRVRVL
jgi:hypothetical protein